MSELECIVREISLQSSIEQIRVLLDLLRTVLQEPGTTAAAVRASAVRQIVRLGEAMMKITG